MMRQKSISTFMGVKADSDPDDTELMFHRIRLRVKAEISEGNFYEFHKLVKKTHPDGKISIAMCLSF